jgi:hypothetical protein
VHRIMGPCRNCDVTSRHDWRTTPEHNKKPLAWVSVGRIGLRPSVNQSVMARGHLGSRPIIHDSLDWTFYVHERFYRPHRE